MKLEPSIVVVARLHLATANNTLTMFTEYLLLFRLNMLSNKLIIGTRGSVLALKQTDIVISKICKIYPEIQIEVIKIKTQGDKITDVPLAKIGVKGIFTKELEIALLDGRIDIAVHSMKDVPIEISDKLHIPSILERETSLDFLISKDNLPIEKLHQNAKIGTSSVRRKAQLLCYRSDFIIKDLRGNLDTRLKKLHSDEFDAIIVSGAGLKRLNIKDVLSFPISQSICMPAVGQGAIGIQTRKDDNETNTMVSSINNFKTEIEVKAERAFLKALGGGCQIPAGAYASLDSNKLTVEGCLIDEDNFIAFKDVVEGDANSSEILGEKLGRILMKKMERHNVVSCM